MSRLYTINIPGNPPRQTHQSRIRAYRIGKFCRIVKAKPDAATARVQAAIFQHIQGMRPAGQRHLIPEGPVACQISWHFQRPKGKQKVDYYGLNRRTQRPDLDNLAKTIMDALTDACAWADDSQVTNLTLAKYNSQEPRLEITFKPVQTFDL